MNSIAEITNAIMRGGLSNDDLDLVIEAVKYARGQIGRAKLRSFGRGDRVKFTSNRNGREYVGTVEDIKIKNVIVATQFGRYRVPANMLEAA